MLSFGRETLGKREGGKKTKKESHRREEDKEKELLACTHVPLFSRCGGNKEGKRINCAETPGTSILEEETVQTNARHRCR